MGEKKSSTKKSSVSGKGGNPNILQITIYGSPEEKAKLEKAAKADGRSLSNFLLNAGIERAKAIAAAK